MVWFFMLVVIGYILYLFLLWFDGFVECKGKV